MARQELKDDVENLLDNKKLLKFVYWWCNGANKNEFNDCKLEVSYEYAMNNYLDRVDVQRAVKFLVETKKDFNLIKIYNTMIQKALEGDVQCANWVVKFTEGSFFKNKKTEIDSILEGLNLNEDE